MEEEVNLKQSVYRMCLSQEKSFILGFRFAIFLVCYIPHLVTIMFSNLENRSIEDNPNEPKL